MGEPLGSPMLKPLLYPLSYGGRGSVLPGAPRNLPASSGVTPCRWVI
jgi:hypothetical protein